MLSSEKSTDKMVEYLALMKVGAVYKRLGFLLEKYFPNETFLLEICEKNLTLGNSKLDVKMGCNKLVKKWRLFVPDGWLE